MITKLPDSVGDVSVDGLADNSAYDDIRDVRHVGLAPDVLLQETSHAGAGCYVSAADTPAVAKKVINKGKVI